MFMKNNLKTFPNAIYKEAFPEKVFIRWKNDFEEELRKDGWK